MRRFYYVVAIALSCILSSPSPKAQGTDSDQFDKQLLPYEAAKDAVTALERQDGKSGLVLNKYTVFEFVLADWNPQSLHWNVPSNLLIYNDGTWFLYARHLANMRRTGGIWDTGRHYTFLANVVYFSGWDPNAKKCVGVVLHSRDYILRGLDYKQEDWDVSATNVDGQLPAILPQVRCASVTRWIR